MFYVSSLEILSKHQKMFLSSGKWYLSVLLPIKCNSYILFQGPLHQYTSVLLLLLIIVVERSRRLSNLLSFLTFYLHRQNMYSAFILLDIFSCSGEDKQNEGYSENGGIQWRCQRTVYESKVSGRAHTCTGTRMHAHAHTHTHIHTQSHALSLPTFSISAAFSFSLTFSLCLSLSPVSLPHCLMTLCDWWPCVIGDPAWLMTLCDWWSCMINTTWQDVKIHLQTENSLSVSLFCTQVLVAVPALSWDIHSLPLLSLFSSFFF